ncbi:ABC transporter permease [Cohnella lupini]|uniref:ABC-2 type transport system permease protein n=1 Tax=Cohnella lupini TaxID=1294267 RepID=A0A3D9I639_9BACL|nr:ABC transporter permease [Cohnella lupini]RED57105.1 ABC-2 type transport system permease protein [Cohnella lupini]
MLDQGQEKQLGFLRSLRQSRAAAFRNEIVPHFRYVFQSGFGLFASAIFFAVLVWYVDLIKDVPEDWPARWVGIAVLSLAALRAPLRTYFRPADSVFLLAMEVSVAQAYIRPALRAAIVAAVLRTLAVFCLFVPVYERAPETAVLADGHPTALLGILFAIVAGCNVYAGWRERKAAAASRRVILKLARWTLSVLVVAVLLLKPLSIAIPLMLLCMLIVILLWKIPSQHALPWDRLIEEEAAIRRRWMAFLGWFVDVPTESSKPSRRRWIAWAGDFMLWKRGRTWHFLYAKSFLRGETFGAYLRWTVLAGIIIAVTSNVAAAGVVYGVAILIGGLQLSELRRVRFVETAATVPIAPEARLVAAAAIARTAGLSMVFILGLVGILCSFQLEVWLPLWVGGMLWCGWWMPRKIAKHSDEDEI